MKREAKMKPPTVEAKMKRPTVEAKMKPPTVEAKMKPPTVEAIGRMLFEAFLVQPSVVEI